MSGISEHKIINYIKKKFPIKNKEILRGIGDDATVLRNGLIISTDSFFENIHFRFEYFDMYSIGYHCLSASLSDLAAMGAKPVGALIAICLSSETGMSDIKELYRGFQTLRKRYNFDIVGGDIVRGQVFGLTITVIGRANKPLLRCGARPGQDLYVTNFLGLAETGRRVLEQGLSRKRYPDSVNKHLFPEPGFDAAKIIKKFATACIDTSDGLSTDSHHLAESSRVKVIIDGAHIPIHPEVGMLCGSQGIDPLDFILSNGEDFELLFTAYNLPKTLRIKIFKIGRVEKGKGVWLSYRGKVRPIPASGYDHLKSLSH
ncbi:thiamine-phosphate kinase [candidate division WOR-3 bacterium 4484_100]|uniref:Thiamine-monophosphate kinase n=1 Tax=candidate division WOR-3 bacterium 4484_100 TaxID=1936077 RepID=A0A1V4QDG5_UNCW3|nr:MAG: thiamine-phosphate kinase [candidate division WOR-3 bacterium 4484_100]